MRFLAGECCDFAVVRALRADGHDVLAVSEFQQRSVDADLIALALSDNRIVLTEDKVFGWLVFAQQAGCPGVVLMRFPATAREILPVSLLTLIADHGSRLPGAFVVLEPGSARINSSLPA